MEAEAFRSLDGKGRKPESRLNGHLRKSETYGSEKKERQEVSRFEREVRTARFVWKARQTHQSSLKFLQWLDLFPRRVHVSHFVIPWLHQMPLLYYWRRDNYRRDLDRGVEYHLNQANPLMHQIELGDSLWAFTRNSYGRHVLAAELVVQEKTLNPVDFRYGRYRIRGDLYKSRYFAVEEGPDIEKIIRALSCRTNASVLGHAFQGRAAVRRLTIGDHHLLSMAARNLPLEPLQAHLIPKVSTKTVRQT